MTTGDALQDELNASHQREYRQSWIGGVTLVLSAGGQGVAAAYAAVVLGQYWLAGGLVLIVVIKAVNDLASSGAQVERASRRHALMLDLERKRRLEQ